MSEINACPVSEPLRVRDIRSSEDLKGLWNEVDLLTLPNAHSSYYQVGFAASDECVELVKRLRFQVFNLELKEGLLEAYSSGLDEDQFDSQMTHVVLLDKRTQQVVGTYRVQTIANALAHEGIYAGQEYGLDALTPLMDKAVECGRACVAQGHRNMRALLTLWIGLISFLRMHEGYWLFGCCSLTSLDPDDGWRALKTIRSEGYLHPELLVPACEAYSCGSPSRELDPDLGPALELPKLFGTYMRLGTKVVSEPALDRAFGTVDFLVLMDVRQIKLSSLNF